MTRRPLEVRVGNRLVLEPGLPEPLLEDLREAFTHANPKHALLRRLGRWTGKVPKHLHTWRESSSAFTLARGSTRKLRAITAQHGYAPRMIDERVDAPTGEWPRFFAEPPLGFVPEGEGPAGVRDYQDVAMDRVVRVEQGLVRVPTGGGKTILALAVMTILRQRTLVIVRDKSLLRQWLRKIGKHFCGAMSPIDVGVVAAGKVSVGNLITIALQQSLWSKKFPLESFAKEFGAVFVDEVHEAAAKTVESTIDAFPARFRIGLSADQTRKDKLECIIYDQFGDVIYEVSPEQLQADGSILPVVVRLVPTGFRADWYSEGSQEERDFGKVLDAIVEDEDRGRLLRSVVLELVAEEEVPILVFTRRREHARRLADEELAADGVPTGLMRGGDGEQRFLEAVEQLEGGRVKVGVGTFDAIGQGIDLPAVRAGVVATPIGDNKQFFGQVRGRICRPTPGKRFAYLYYLWDERLFPRVPGNMITWNAGAVEIHDGERWVPVDRFGRPKS